MFHFQRQETDGLLVEYTLWQVLSSVSETHDFRQASLGPNFPNLNTGVGGSF